MREACISIETFLLALLKGEHNSLTLSFNDYTGPNYLTVAQAMAGGEIDCDWVSEEEKQKAIETNRMWTLQWYPDSPVSFHSLSASSLPVLIEAVSKDFT